MSLKKKEVQLIKFAPGISPQNGICLKPFASKMSKAA